MADSTYDVLVLGGGINGRCALFHLLERGIDRVGLVERFDLDPRRRGSTYSKGNRQKVALVAALASDVRIRLREDYHAFPIRPGPNTHYAMKRRDFRFP